MNLLNKKKELDAEMVMLNSLLTDIETKIAIYSTMDMVRVSELSDTKKELELLFLDLLSDTNDLYLASLKKTA